MRAVDGKQEIYLEWPYQGCELLVWVSEQLRAPEIGKYGCCETGCLPSDPNRAIP